MSKKHRNRITAILLPRSRVLLEFVAAKGPQLKIDRDKGVIYGVKVLGRYSKNSHGLTEAENGTEYPLETQRRALPLLEGVKVKTDHPADRQAADKERSIFDTFGVLHNPRIEGDDTWADLHYLKTHPLAESVLEDVERGLGVYGLSHNATAAKEHFDRNAKRLVIDEIGAVRSVDLVDRPATNRNLWESSSGEPTVATKTVKYSLRSILESQRSRFSKNRLGYMDRLLEAEDDPDMKKCIAEEYEEDQPADLGPDDQIRTAFQSSIMSMVEKALGGDMDMKECLNKIKQLMTTHGKLTEQDEPDPIEESEEDEDDEKKKVPSAEEKTVKESLARLVRKDACRDLCESMNFIPTKAQLDSLMEVSTEAARRTIVESFAAKNTNNADSKRPRSRAPGTDRTSGGSGRPLTESIADDIGLLRNGR
jgi:hypothetical protein